MALLKKGIIAVISAGLTACATPSPEIKRVTARPPSNPEMAALDLSGLSRVDAVKAGTTLGASVKLISPGAHTLHFSFNAVTGRPDQCLKGRSERTRIGPGPQDPALVAHAETRTRMLLRQEAVVDVLFYGTLLVVQGTFYGIRLTCRGVSSGLDKPRRCYGVRFTARKGVTYVPRMSGGQPVVTDGRSGATVSSTTELPCSAVDGTIAAAEKAAEAKARAKLAALEARLGAKARRGDSAALHKLFMSAPIFSAREWRWLCLAAHGGHSWALVKIGNWYASGRTVERNATAAHMWYTLLQRKKPEEAQSRLRIIETQMTSDQIARAKQLAARWKPNPRECRQFATTPGKRSRR